MKNLTLLVICVFLFSAKIKAQEFSEIIKPHLEKQLSNGELLPSDINWEVTKEHISSISNIHHIYFTQTINKIQIANTASSIHLNERGDVITSNINFIKNSFVKSKGISSPSISAIKAIQLISYDLGYTIKKPLKVFNKKTEANQKMLVSNGGISENDISAELIYSLNNDNELTLAWEVSILEIGYMHSWDVLIDALSGKIIDKIDLVIYCNYENEAGLETSQYSSFIKKSVTDSNNLNCQECYEVVAMPLESPYYGERSIVVNPSDNEASPFGWHDIDGIDGDEYYTTRGNNINAYISSSGEGDYQPYGGELLEFTEYPFDQEFSEEERFLDASITNLFYWGNIAHDVFYRYGFNEQAGNFQVNNYGNGGHDEDPIIAKGQLQLDFCNAYFIPFSDGNRSFLVMNACGDKDGSFDNLTIVHEYTHGLTNRILGSGAGCRKDETPWEGWSDWYGLMLTLSPEDVSETPRGIATYLLGQGAEGQGGRPFPYSTDMNINPQTYDYIKYYENNHKVGSVWASILWELTWVLIEEYGYDPDIYNFKGDINQDAGNIIAMAIVTEGLKIGDCSDGFVEARNAIFLAFNTIYEGEPDCFLWEAFAKRGLGFYASEGSADDVTDGVESFEMPPSSAEFDFQLGGICPSANKLLALSGGNPKGGVYNGLGVIDAGNGFTFSFDPAIAGIGLHTITYEILDSECAVASTDEGSIEVIADIISPDLTCTEEVTVNISTDIDFYSVIDFSYLIYYSDNCNNEITVTQSPDFGTLVGVGSHIIEFEVKDYVGNMTNCSFNLIVENDAEEIANAFDVYPNPTANDILMMSTIEIGSLTTEVFDINGRLIFANEFNEFGFEKRINLKELAKGIYFLKISTTDFNIVKRIIKK